MNTKEIRYHLGAVVAALEAWRQSLPDEPPVIERKPKPKPVPRPRPPKPTEAEVAAATAEAVALLAPYRYCPHRNVYLNVDLKRRACARELTVALYGAGPIVVGRHKYTAADYVGHFQHATNAEIIMCGVKP